MTIIKKAVFLPFFLIPFVIVAQDLTGIWRGYFYSGKGEFKNEYKYEVQINQLPNKALQGVTYSYQQQNFYGKAEMQGIFLDKAQTAVLKETKLVEVKMSEDSEAEIMTCYLDYAKGDDGREYLRGTYSSTRVNDSMDGKEGKIVLQRVKDSHFGQEDFLVKKNKQGKPATGALSSSAKAKAGKATVSPRKFVIGTFPQNDSLLAATPGDNSSNTESGLWSVPQVLKDRENKLVRVITTRYTDIKIQLYDNGEIDGDTITVYDNNKLVAFRKGLSDKPITLDVKASVEKPIHEFVMVADNLGSIPPNTALMVVSTGDKRYELFISSDRQRNAKVVIEYKK